MNNDDDLRARYRELKSEDESTTPPFSPVPRNTLRATSRSPRSHRAWYSPDKLITLGATLAGFLIVLLTGLALGTNTGYASAQIENQKERIEIVANARSVSDQLAELRNDLSRARTELAQFTSGNAASGTQKLAATSAGLQRMENALKDIELTLASSGQSTDSTSLVYTNGIPMKRALAATCAVLSLTGSDKDSATTVVNREVQPAIPVVELLPVTAKSTETFGSIQNLRELPGGKLLVDDGARRLVKLTDAALASTSIVLDSARGSSNWYGGVPLQLMPFVGDSTLFADVRTQVVSVIGPDGAMVRSLAMPTAGDIVFLRRGASDNAGRLIFATEPAVLRQATSGKAPLLADSTPLLRADFTNRRTDTVAFVKRPLARADAVTARGGINSYWQPDLLGTIDEWTVLSDGTLAIVRGHDYHVDFIRPDGTKSSSQKLAFDWRQLTDADKQRMIDSVQKLRVLRAQNNTLVGGVEKFLPWRGTSVGQEFGPGTPGYPVIDSTSALYSNNSGGIRMLVLPAEVPTIDKVFDYYPPIRSGGVYADFENQLWVLPTTSKQSRNGELVYDVISNKGELLKRVRMPVGKYIVGFGRNGVVYLGSGGYAGGFTIERSKVPAISKTK